MNLSELKCRICLQDSSRGVVSLKDSIPYEPKSYSEVYRDVTNFPITKAGPQKLCSACTSDLLGAYDFKKRCEKSEEILNGNVNVKTESTEYEVEELEELDDFELKPDPASLIYIATNESIEQKQEVQNKACIDEEYDWDEPSRDDYLDEEDDDEEGEEEEVNIETFSKKVIPCPYCDRKFTDVGLKRHCRSAHLDQQEKCLICSEDFYLPGQLQRHIELGHHLSTSKPTQMHKKRIKRERQDMEDVDTKIKRRQPRVVGCSYCPYECNTYAILNNHCREEHEDQKLQCPDCPEQYYLPSRLKRHRKTVHGYKEPDKKEKSICCHCGKILSSVSLDIHIRTVHRREFVEYICNICGVKITTKPGLITHMRLKHIGSEYKCRYCDETFANYGIRRTHEFRFHTFAYKYECNICNLKFITNSSLKKHRVTHTGEKNYQCSICGMQFSWRSAMRRHIDTHNEGKEFVCEICSAAFKTRKSLKAHYNVHLERKYECPVCGQKFLVNQAMRIHCTRNHPDYQLPPPGTVMNKQALQKISAINEKYNVNLTNLSIPKKLLPVVDVPYKNPDQVRYQVSNSIYRTGAETMSDPPIHSMIPIKLSPEEDASYKHPEEVKYQVSSSIFRTGIEIMADPPANSMNPM